jgi:peptide/nickel transport system ATP-binding protein
MLLDACPDLHVGRMPENRYRPTAQGTAPPILEIDALHCRYRRPGSLPLAPGRYNEAVSDLSLSLQVGESLGIVGESGSGKSTLAKAIAGLVRPWRGSIRFKGERIDRLSPKARLIARLPINMIFQDPMGSLNPRHTILQSITEPLHLRSLSPRERRDAAVKALRAVKLEDDALPRYPHQFSGGQRQRIATARALIAEPELVIADEPVAALDVSIQAQIIDLLNELRERLNLTLIFISHDLAVVRHTTDRTIVMADSRIVETGPTEQLFTDPKADYTRKLLEAVLPADPDLARARIGKN